MNQFVPKAHLQAAEAYFDSFRDLSARKIPNQLDYSTKSTRTTLQSTAQNSTSRGRLVALKVSEMLAVSGTFLSSSNTRSFRPPQLNNKVSGTPENIRKIKGRKVRLGWGTLTLNRGIFKSRLGGCEDMRHK